MRLLLLMLALQSKPAVRATAADSAAARAGLTRVLATLDSLGSESITHREAWRLLVQMNLWGMVDVGTRTAFRLDSTLSPTRETNYWLVQQWAVERASVGDSVTVEAILKTAPSTAQEELLNSLASSLRFTRPEVADRFEDRLTRPTAKAERLRRVALNARSNGDSTEAQGLFEEVVRLTRTDPNGGWEPMYMLYQLLEIGVDVRLDDLLGTVDKATDDWWAGRTEVAKALLRSKRTELAQVVIDSLAANIETQLPARRPSSRAELHQMRGTAPDSAIARAITDSLAKAHAVGHPPPYEIFDARMVYDRDTTAIKAILSRENIDNRVILQLVYSVRGYVSASIATNRYAAAMDSLRSSAWWLSTCRRRSFVVLRSFGTAYSRIT